MAKRTGSRTSTSTRCKPSADCRVAGKRLKNKKSSIAGKYLGAVCKPAKKKRKATGCLNGVGGASKVAQISQKAKQIRKPGEAWSAAIKRAAKLV